MTAIKVMPKSHEEWLENRTLGIGASEVGTLLGINKWETPYQLWLRKTGQAPGKEENEAMLMGHLLEDAVAKRWEIETDRQVIKSTAGDWMYVDKDKPYLRVSPDRLFWLPGEKKNNRNKGILECKTTFNAIDENNIPMTWFCQIQMNLGVSGFQHGALAWLTKGRDFGYMDIEFDKEFYKYMVDAIDKFWNENVKKGIAPDAVTEEDLKLIYPKSQENKVIDATDEVYEMLDAYKKTQEEIEAAKEKSDKYLEAIKLYMKDAEILRRGVNTVATWKSSKDSEKFDTKRFKEDHPEMVAQYIKIQAGSRRFSVK